MVWWLWANSLYPFPQAYGAQAEDAAQPLSAHASHLSKHGLQACCIWNAQDGFYHFSDNWTRVTHLLPTDCMGLGLLEYLSPDASADFAQAVQDLYSPDPHDACDAATIECEVMRGNGQWGWLNVTLVPMQMAGRRVMSILLCDVTEQKQLAEAADIAQRESELAHHGRASFLSNMSHELRTPLNAILGFAQMLQMGGAPSEASALEYLTHIRESGEDLLTKINDLIEIANIDTRRCRLQEEPLNLHDLLNAAMEMHSHRCFENNITIRCEHDKHHLVIQGDRSRLIHIISQLLSNAVKHSKSGDVITLSTSASTKDGVSISIRDTGRGIDKQHLDNIRLALHSEHAYYATDIDNIGVGLALAKELAHLHQGRLTLDSIAGNGVTASLHLPASRIASLSAKVKPKRLAGSRQSA